MNKDKELKLLRQFMKQDIDTTTRQGRLLRKLQLFFNEHDGELKLPPTSEKSHLILVKKDK